MTMRRVAALMLSVGVLASGEAIAQTQKRDAGIPSNFTPAKSFKVDSWTDKFFRLPGLSKDYRLGPGDQLDIAMYGLGDDTYAVTVSNGGDITLPLIGAVHAADLTATELEAAIAARLVERKLIQQPEVLVYVTEYQAKPIYLIGELDNPGQYVMSQQWTLTEAVLIAGGLDYGADRYGYLHRLIAPEGGAVPPAGLAEHPNRSVSGREVIKIDLQPLKDGRVFDPDIPLRAGDVFIVPRRNIEFFYVIGDVVRAGAFEYPVGQNLTVSKAISGAGGPTKTAKMSEGILVRNDKDGRRVERKADYAAVLRGEASDFEVQPNDVIFVPGATSKTVAYGLVNTIPSILSNALIYSIIW